MDRRQFFLVERLGSIRAVTTVGGETLLAVGAPVCVSISTANIYEYVGYAFSVSVKWLSNTS